MCAERPLLLALTLAATLAGLGCTSALGSGRSVQSDVDDLRLSVDRLRQQQVETLAKVDGMSGGLQEDPEQLSFVVSELRDRLDILSAQVEAMAQRMEMRNDDLEGVRYDLMRLDRLVAEAREMVSQAVADPLVEIDPVTGAPLAPGVLTEEPESETEPLPEPEPAMTAADDPSGIFQRAYGDYTRGDYALAAIGFRTVLSRSPRGALADDAIYYLAAIDSAEGRDEDALAGYARLTDEYPDADKAPSALLKRGLLLIDANRIGEGVVQLDHLVKTYPETDEARLARNKLRALGVGF